MENMSKIAFKKLWNSFGYGFTGIKDLLRSEQNARIHLFVSCCVVLAGFLLTISPLEWCIVALCIGLVFAAEAFNTAIEKLIDHLFETKHETARFVKDVSAGGVLIAATSTIVCGVVIFLPKILDLLLH